MTPEEIDQLKFLLDKAIVKLDLGVRDVNALRGAKFIMSHFKTSV